MEGDLHLWVELAQLRDPVWAEPRTDHFKLLEGRQFPQSSYATGTYPGTSKVQFLQFVQLGQMDNAGIRYLGAPVDAEFLKAGELAKRSQSGV